MRFTVAISLVGLAAAGCSQATKPEGTNEAAAPNQEQAANAADDRPAEPQRDEAEAGGEEGAGGTEAGNGAEGGASLPPAGAGLRFVGRWAADARSCGNLAWRFTANRLETPAGSVCTFSKVTPVGGGYDIAATCTAESPPREDLLRIRFAESAKAMTFESKSIADAGLVYCGRGG